MGLSGKMVNVLLANNGLRRSETFLTNAALCRGESDKDNDEAARCCAPRLLSELKPHHPAVPILSFGRTAAATLLDKKSIMAVRGFVWRGPEVEAKLLEKLRKAALKQVPFTEGRAKADLKFATAEGRSWLVGRVILPTLHPAYVMRDETSQPILRADFKRAARIVKGGTRPRLSRRPRRARRHEGCWGLGTVGPPAVDALQGS